MNARPLPRPRPNALPRWQRFTVFGAALLLLASGLAWQLALKLRSEPELPGQLEPWLARWHALSAMAGLFAVGMVAALHIGRGWSLGRRRTSGVAVCALLAALALSGFWLSYLVSEAWRPAVGWAHFGLGALAFALGLVHRRTG